MREVLDTLMVSVPLAGFYIPVAVLVFAGLLLVTAATRNTTWAILGAVMLFFFELFLPALNRL